MKRAHLAVVLSMLAAVATLGAMLGAPARSYNHLRFIPAPPTTAARSTAPAVSRDFTRLPLPIALPLVDSAPRNEIRRAAVHVHTVASPAAPVLVPQRQRDEHAGQRKTQVQVLPSTGVYPVASWYAHRVALGQCESGQNYTNKRNPKYRGYYQIGYREWAGAGGTGDPADAPPAEQDARALRLYQARGWYPWTCARILHLI